MNVALRPWNVLSLCAGVGGLDLGIHIAEPGSRSVAYLEREAYAAATLAARMEAGDLAPAPVWSDLTTFDARAWRGLVHCVASGDPCQPNSVAGKGLGADDDRWLAEHVVRIFDESGARRLFRENVPGNADGQLAYFVPALEALGCRVAVGIFSARGVGASHQRERLFIMADREGGGFGEFGAPAWPGRVGYADRSEPGLRGDVADASHDHRGRGERGEEAGAWSNGERGRGSSIGGADVADPCGGELQRRGELGELRRPQGAAEGEGDQRQRDGRHAGDRGAEISAGMADAGSARLQGRELGGACDDERHGPDAHGPASELRGARLPLFAPGPSDPRWPDIIARAPELEPAVRRMADGLAPGLDLGNRVDRLRACGNGVVPLTAAYAWRCLGGLLDG